jgi:hypothetical protein
MFNTTDNKSIIRIAIRKDLEEVYVIWGKKSRTTSFILVLVFFTVLSLLGCNSNSDESSPVKNASTTPTTSITTSTSPVLVKSSNGRISISAPDGWRSDDSLWTGPEISLSGWDYYVVVLEKHKSNYADGFTANDFLTSARSDFDHLLYNINWKPSSNITIGGLSGVTVQMNAKNQGNRAAVVYLISVVADNNNFYEIIGWTSADRGDIDLQYLQNVMNGLKVR